jgi:tricorn protease
MKCGTRKLLILALSALALGACTPTKKPSTKQRPEPPRLALEEAAKPVGAVSGLGEEYGAYPRFPDLHGEVVVFAAEGDLWQASLRGGLARRLTSHPGTELFPHFSPDGKHLAFSGEYDGNQDVFVMPAVGGAPRRLSFHPALDQVLGWTAKGDAILFRSQRDHPHGDWTLYTISPEGGDPTRLPLSRAARLAYEPGGERVAVNLTDRDFRRWKRYAGGTSAQIFVGDLKGGPFRKLTTFKGTNAYPMWHGGRIYFLSDRTGTENLWSMTPEGQDLKQHTRFDDYDVRFPSLGDGRIVFQHRAELQLLDLKSGAVRPIPVRVLSDALSTRTRFTDPARYLRRYELSPDGKYLGLEIRGNLHLIPAAKEGRRIRVSRGSASRQQGISFSDDGKQIATTSDASGETEIAILDSRGVKEPRALTRGGARFKYPPLWAPGGKLIAYAESDNRLYLVSSVKGDPVEVDHSPYDRITDYAFSPDGRWLAYSKVEENYFSSIFLYDCERKKSTRVTESSFNDWYPTWSTDGKYLAFLSDRTINPFVDRLDLETIIDKATKPYLVLLAQKTPSPFLPRDPERDEEKEKKEKAAEKAKAGEQAKLPTVTVDLEGIGDRIVEVPVPAGNLGGLQVGEDAILYLSHPSRGMTDWEKIWWGAEEPTATLKRFDLKKKKEATFAEGIVSYEVSRDGKTIVLRRKKTRLYAFKLAEKAPTEKELAEHALPLPAIREQVDPPAEWRQIYREVWRMMRDFYFAEDMGKVDWAAMGKKYLSLLDRIASREELEDLLGELVAELSLGHTYIWGGEMRPVERVPVGLLGADLEPDAASGHYRFKRIYAGANWDPERLSPLTLSHVKVREGDYLIKIDGRPIKVGESPYSRLQRAAGELVQLTVSSDPKGVLGRDVEITTLKKEGPVRYHAWVKQNRERVAAQTKGQVGYLHLPDMMTAGMVEFDRWYYPQVRKAGLIVDGRWNRGGFVSQIMIKRLMRTILSWSKSRSGWVGPYPENTLNGRVVVLTNERAGSDGDIFARAVQVAKIGPVIGTRTWGGVVGINMSHPLVDKGVSTRPGYFAWWEPARGFRLEGEGVTPDLVVENDPGAEFRGTDAQLEKGIETMLELLRKNPPKPPAFGESPDKRKETWVKSYGQTDRP